MYFAHQPYRLGDVGGRGGASARARRGAGVALALLLLAGAALADHRDWPQTRDPEHLGAPGGITDLDYHAFYVHAEGGGVERLNPVDGKRAWHVPAARAPVALLGELLIASEGAGDADGGTRLLGIERETGKVRWTSNELAFIGVSQATQSHVYLRPDGPSVIVHVHAFPRHDFRGRIVVPGSPAFSLFWKLDPKTGQCTPAPALEARWVELALEPPPAPPEPPVPGVDSWTTGHLLGNERVYVFGKGDEITWFKTAPAGGKVTAGPVTLHTSPGGSSKGWGLGHSTDRRHIKLSWHADDQKDVYLFDAATGRRLLTSVNFAKLENASFLARGKRIWYAESPTDDAQNRPVAGKPCWVRPGVLIGTDLQLKELWRRPLYGNQEFELMPRR